MATANYVTAAKPAVGGAVYVADTTVTLPTDATSDLSSDFTCLGYISEDGLTNGSTLNTETKKAWGGDEVIVINQGRDDTFSFTLIEALNVDVLKFVFGEDNVSGSLEEGIIVNVNSDDLAEQAMVIDMIMRNGALKRICIPDAAVSEVGEVPYSDSDISGYEVTVTAIADEAGNKHYEYISSASSTDEETTEEDTDSTEESE